MDEKFSNKEITRLLRNIAAVYLLTNENRFRIIAYENAATNIEHLTRELKDIWQDGKLTDVPGIGSTLASHLDEYFKTGKSKHFDSVLKNIPSTVFLLMQVPSIGPKKAFKLVNELRLFEDKTVYADLKKAAEENRIAELETFGKKSQEDILESLKLFKARKSKEKRMPLPYAFKIAEEITEYLKRNKNIKRIDVLGSLRRKVATIGDVDIAVEADNKYSVEIIEYFNSYPKKLSLINFGEKKSSIIVAPYIRVDLRVQDSKTYGTMLQYFTGSKAYNIKLREYVMKRKLSLNEYGIKSHSAKASRDEGLVTFPNEADLYHYLDLEYIPPEIREGTNEIEIAKKNKLPKLVETAQIKGDMHLHSSYDLKPSHDLGQNTYKEILQKAEALSYEYVGFADHNPKIGDLSAGEIIDIMKKRKDFIDKSCKPEKVRYFIGLETDILPSGEIALPVEASKYLDYMVVSVHSSFAMNIKDMTKRVLKALTYPKVKILGHPTGRLLEKRDGYELDWQAVFTTCSKKNIAIEINSWPERLDLPDSLVRMAIEAGVKLCIDTDAHANPQMDNMFYGVSVARRGWCKKDDIINTKGYNEFRNWLMS